MKIFKDFEKPEIEPYHSYGKGYPSINQKQNLICFPEKTISSFSYMEKHRTSLAKHITKNNGGLHEN